MTNRGSQISQNISIQKHMQLMKNNCWNQLFESVILWQKWTTDTCCHHHDIFLQNTTVQNCFWLSYSRSFAALRNISYQC